MILERDGVRLSYLVSGDGAPVTFLHGFTQSSRSWHEVLARMPPGYAAVTPDLRGHGQTRIGPGERCTIEGCASDLESLWDHLGIEKTHLVGYSMGGRLALSVAAGHPDRLLSLLTIGAHAGLEPEARAGRRAGDEALATRIESDGVEAFVRYWEALPLFAGIQRRGPAFAAQVRAERLENSAAGLACSLRGMGAGVMEPVWDELGRLRLTCTFVAGQLDHGYVASARRLAATVPQGRLQVVPRAGHPVHQERPDAFARVLSDHLDAARPAVSSSSTTVD